MPDITIPLAVAAADSGGAAAAGGAAAGAGAGAAGGIFGGISGNAALGAGMGLIGDVGSLFGQSQTNATQVGMSQAEMQWETQMADTQMQRRVADLKAAGLNPMLAVSSPGAAVPSPVMPSMQNPAGAMSQLGNQATSALQLSTQDAQIKQMQASADQAAAQARSTDARTTQELPAEIESIKSGTGLNTERAQEVHANVQLLNYGLSSGVSQDVMNEQGAQAAIKTHLMQVDQQERQDTLLSVIRARNDVNYAESIGARNIYQASDTAWARLMSLFAVPGINSAMNVGETVAGGLMK